MTEEKDNQEQAGLGENLKAVGQIIVGEIETIGGILTGDPVTRAEGDFNVEMGARHQESNKNLIAVENRLQSEQIHPNEFTQTENKE